MAAVTADGKTALDLFSEAVRATFHRWTALNLAVGYSWGDGNENHKREDLIQQTIGGFATAKRAPDPTELEAFLDNYLQDNFNLHADDESPYEVVRRELSVELLAVVGDGRAGATAYCSC